MIDSLWILTLPSRFDAYCLRTEDHRRLTDFSSHSAPMRELGWEGGVTGAIGSVGDRVEENTLDPRMKIVLCAAGC